MAYRATWRQKAGEQLAQVNAWVERAKTEHAPPDSSTPLPRGSDALRPVAVAESL